MGEDGGVIHVHYDIFLDAGPAGYQGVVGGVDVDNRIDPQVYWTSGVNPNTGPNATGLYAYATPVTDWDQNGSIDTQGALSESAGFIKEGQSSILKLGVNTSHTLPLTLRVQFDNAPDGMIATALRGIDGVSWDGNTLLVTLAATASQSEPNTVGYLQLTAPEDDNTLNETLAYSVSVDGPAGAVFGSAPAQSLFLIDNDTPQAPGDINVPDVWVSTGENTGVQRNGTELDDRAGTSDTRDFDSDGDNDLGAVNGTANADRIHGQSGDDDIFGNGGGDFLYGDADNDRLYAYNLNTVDAIAAYLDGGAGKDILVGGQGNDYLVGGPDDATDDNDALQSGAGDDTILGGGGNDVLAGGIGADVLKGGEGDDHLFGSATYIAQGRNWTITPVADVIANPLIEADGTHIYYTIATGFAGYRYVADAAGDALFGEKGSDQLEGGAGADYLDGGDDADLLWGLAGDDVIVGGAGNDIANGGFGDDALFGGDGNDDLSGDRFDPTTGQEGNDYLDGGTGDDKLHGHGGNDTYYFARGYGKDEIFESDGTDIIRLGSGILPNAVQLSSVSSEGGAGLILTLSTGDSLTVWNWWNAANEVEYIQFEDGTVWDETVLSQKSGLGTQASNFLAVEFLDAYQDALLTGTVIVPVLSGVDGDDTLVGATTDDTLFGGAGADVLSGEAGNDRLQGGADNDTLFGGGNDDLLFGEEGDDWLEGGAGSDQLVGGAGADTLVGGLGDDILYRDEFDTVIFRPGDGHDQVTFVGAGIIQLDSFSIDQLQIGSTVGFDGWQYLTLVSGNDSLFIQGGFLGSNQTYLIDGAALTQREFMQYVPSLNVQGRITDDTIYGGNQNDTLDGGVGNDTLYGQNGDDALSGGTGNDLLHGEQGADTLYGQAGDDTLEGNEGNDWLDGGDGADLLRGGDGNDTLDAGAGNDTLYGQGGDDILDGRVGDDRLEGGDGSDVLDGGTGDDTYIFSLGDGQDTVLDASRSAFRFAAGISPETILLSQHLGNDGSQYLRIGYSGSDTVSIRNGLLDAGQTYDFNGTILTHREMLQRAPSLTVVGTDAADTLTGSHRGDDLVGNAGADVLEGQHGNDSLDGGLGNDTYVFNSGDGQDTITDYDPTAGNADVLRFGAGIRSQDLRLEWINRDLVIRIGGAGDKLAVKEWFDSAQANRIERFEFADGTAWDESAIANRITPVAPDQHSIGTSGDDLLVGGPGNDTLQGLEGNDRLYGLDGNDTLFGGAGDDTYYFETGDGQDDILEGTGTDQIVFGPGIRPDDMRIARFLPDLSGDLGGSVQFLVPWYIEVGLNGDRLRVPGTAPTLGIERFVFADGTTLSYDEMVSRQGGVSTYGGTFIGSGSGGYVRGTSGNDTFVVSSGNSLIRTGGGNNNVYVAGIYVPGVPADGGGYWTTVIGGNGNDTYHHQGGSHVTIIDTARPGAGNVLRFGGGISRSSLRLRRGSFAIEVEDGGEIHMPNFDPNNVLGVHAIDTFEFDDGTTLSYAELIGQGFDIDGTADDDILEGTNVTDRITGGFGNDSLIGGTGNDGYFYTLGDGTDTIQDSAGNDILALSGVALPDLNTSVSGDDLILELPDGNTITVQDWFLGTDNQLETIALDGVSYTGSFIEAWGHAPILAASVPDTSTDEDSPLNLDISTYFTDADLTRGDVLTYSVTLTDGNDLPTWLAFDVTTGSFTGTPLQADVGSLDIEITATDAMGRSASEVFTLTINNVNDAPIVAISILDQVIDEDSLFSFTLSAETFADEDSVLGDTLTLYAGLADGSALPDWLSFDSAIGQFTGTPDNLHVGAYEIRVMATDAAGTSADDVISLTVNNVNDAPVLTNALADQMATEGAAFSYALPGDTFHDDDAIHGDTLSYTASVADGSALPSWLGFDAATQTLFGTASADSTLTGTDGNDVLVDTDTGISGTWDIAVTATDTSGVSASDSFTLTLQGIAGNDILNGGKGNDVLNGGGGNDTYLYNAGDGLDQLTDSSGADTVSFGSGISFANTVIRKDSNTAHLRLLDVDGNETNEGMDIALNGDGTSPIEAFAFQDGSSHTLADLTVTAQTWYGDKKANTIITGRNDDTVYAGKGGDTVYGRTGNDTLYGDKGNDKLYGEGGNDKLYGGKGKDFLDGGAGDDILDGGEGHNTLIGGQGNDTLILGKGEDTVRFGLGDGWDTLKATAKDPEDSKIRFGEGITKENLWLSRSGNDLQVNVLGTDDGITIENWFNNKHKPIEEFKTANGDELEAKQVGLLIQAMAGFTPVPGSGGVLPTVMPDELQATLAAAWESEH